MGALTGYTVVDLTQGYGGPFCTMQLADFGANVIKVEKKGFGDVSRKRLPIKNSRSGFFVTYNRGKKSLALDLEKQGGRDILTGLISEADVLVVDYEAEYIRDLDLGYGRLAQLNPRLIYASISGFGEYGPMSSYRAHDITVQAASGRDKRSKLQRWMPCLK
jgi:CoA:oxalate CoA-transferase